MEFNIFHKIKIFLRELDAARTLRGKVRNQSARTNLQKNLLKKEDSSKSNENVFIANKMQSMSDSQGVSDFSGSAYNGPGNVDREKVNSNMSQRNFER